jgi:hypothetical protein
MFQSERFDVKYRKRPLVVDAEQWKPGREVVGVVFPIPEEHRDALRAIGENIDLEQCGLVRTLEGPFVCWSGDWIITGVKGERWPVKPDVFEASYEPADQTPAAS